MSNFIYNGYNFTDNLLKKWFLQNALSPVNGETQEMNLQLLDYQSNGFEFVTQNVFGNSSNFVFRNIISNVETILLTYNTTTNNFILAKPVSLANNQINLLANPSISTDAANKGYVDTAVGVVAGATLTLTGAVTASGSIASSITTTLTLRLDQINAPTAAVNLNSQKITNLATPTLSSDASTRGYIDNKTLNTFAAPILALSLNNQKITNLATPTISTDASTMGYVDNKIWTVSQISNFNTSVSAFRLDQFAIPTASLNLNSKNIVSMADPVNAQDAATRAYVDAATGGGLPIGTVIMWATETVPTASWLIMDGSAISRTTYATLFALLGTRWGQGNNSTTFNLPDSGGMFPRGWTDTSANDPDAAARTASNIGGVTGNHVGTKQTSQYQSHLHTATTNTVPDHQHNDLKSSQVGSFATSGVGNNGASGVATGLPITSLAGSHTHTVTIGNAGGSETRPINFSILFIIKAL